MSGSGGKDTLRERLRRASLIAASSLVGFGLAAGAVVVARAAHSESAASMPPGIQWHPKGVSDRADSPPLRETLATAAAQAAPEPAAAPLYRLDVSGRLTASGVIRPGGSLTSALASQGLSAAAIHTIAQELKPVFDFRRARAGDTWRVVHDETLGVLEFDYGTADMAHYRLERRGDRYVAERHEPEMDRRTARIAGIVATSLYDAIRDLGESPQLASDFAELFAWDVDFSRAVQAGDRFAILYERLYRQPPGGEAQYVGPGRILAARYEGQTGVHRVAYFEQGEAHGGYYRDDGSSVERQFLVAPVKYSRIASRFTNSRHHPILKINRPHYGIDYAAPTGTPIFAVAEGQVVYRGWSSGYGKLVKLRHSNGYVSYYAHMSRFADTVKMGDWVHQKQVIGYVGATGLATGPHVCFRVKNRDGRFVNPAQLRTPSGEAIPADRLPEFRLVSAALFAQLDGPPAIATEEAF